MESENHPLFPFYRKDLHWIFGRIYGYPTPLPAGPIPGGPIRERVLASPCTAGEALAMCNEFLAEDETTAGATEVGLGQYLQLALPHRLLLHGLMVDLAGLEMNLSERIQIEESMIAWYERDYLGAPLPPRALELLRSTHSEDSSAGLLEWVDSARVILLGTTHFIAATDARTAFRRDALRQGASGSWQERTVAAAELMVDLLFLCWASKRDLQTARSMMERFGGSLSLSFQAFEGGPPALDEALGWLMFPFPPDADETWEDRVALRAFARRRSPLWENSLLSGSVATNPAVSIGASQVESPEGSNDGENEARESATETYRRLKEVLGESIHFADLVQALALVGTASLHGVTHQRVLLAGPPGSGKTHAARALAKALGSKVLQVDMSDVTATGWAGASIPDILEELAGRTGESLDNAVLHLDEIDKVGVLSRRTDGNSREAKIGLQASILALLDGNPVTTSGPSTRQFDTDKLLIIGTGAFGGRFVETAPTTADLIRWGWMPEFAARWGERYCLRSPTYGEAVELLRKSDRSVGKRLGPLMEALGISVEVPDEVFRYVASRWLASGTDFRTAAEWLLDAARRRLVAVLETGGYTEIVLTPDDLEPGAVPKPLRRP